ncbi:hypothetical protein [Aeromicrobium sp.]|uniref:hypothetical protein n=1 Tax=Aeromicrobium sp. TaxID=1871063 RepID=UPI0025C4EC60|nr:hypothetical protein [Aeromicrobium sp.]MCK5890578.1 hypothetical protein [Aeromicrobium sp.]
MPDAHEPVGTLAEEAARLLAAVLSGSTSEAGSDEPTATGDASSTHGCTHGWCPLCQAADYLQEHPEVVSQVLVAGAELMKVVRDAVDKAGGRGHGHDEEPGS